MVLGMNTKFVVIRPNIDTIRRTKRNTKKIHEHNRSLQMFFSLHIEKTEQQNQKQPKNENIR
jgi:hypothetical protein